MQLQHVATMCALRCWLLAGCRQDMQDQPKFFPQRGTTFYADGRSVRPQVENTVARSQLHEDAYFYTGLVDGKEGDGLPFPVTLQVLERGQERYNVYCTPCHSRVGNGEGMIVQRGYRQGRQLPYRAAETAPLGHFFHVITNGYGAMPDYASQVTPADRWAIVAYIRALQLSQNAPAGRCSCGRARGVAQGHRRARGHAGLVCGGVEAAGDRGYGNAGWRTDGSSDARRVNDDKCSTGSASRRPSQLPLEQHHSSSNLGSFRMKA